MKETYPRPRPKRPQDGASADGIIEGRNAVAEALRAGTPIDKVFLLKGEVDLPCASWPTRPGSRGPCWQR
ncbi:MAG: RNA methyltransferase substrate-binding domain-containing protein [Evtepia sp.]